MREALCNIQWQEAVGSSTFADSHLDTSALVLLYLEISLVRIAHGLRCPMLKSRENITEGFCWKRTNLTLSAKKRERVTEEVKENIAEIARTVVAFE